MEGCTNVVGSGYVFALVICIFVAGGFGAFIAAAAYDSGINARKKM